MNVETERKRLEKLYGQRIPAALLLNVFLSATVGAYLATVAMHRANPEHQAIERRRSPKTSIQS